ncbi:lysine-specific demethylase JMJ25-like protein, partial [Tanacetum coccineum]
MVNLNYTSNTWSDDDPLILHVPETSKRKKPGRKEPVKSTIVARASVNETSKINLSKVNIQDQQKEGSVTERKKDKKPDTSNTWSDDDPLILHVPETSKRKKPGRKEPVKSTIVARASVNDTSNTWSDDDPLILHVPETSKRKKHKKPAGRKEPVKSTIVAPLKNKKIQKNFNGNVKLQHLPIKQIPLVDKVKNFDGNVKLLHLHILFTSLIPYVKCIFEEQKVELLMEANALGVQVSSLTIKKSMAIDERLSCNFCSTSLVGVYRGCSKCNKYDVCLACCRDFRNNKPLNKVAEFGKCGNFENYWHARSNITCSKWRIENDKILCPTCDNSVLELTDTLENDRFSNLEARANSANSKIETNNLTDSKSQQLDESFGECLKAASRDLGDDFLYNPLSKDVYEKDDLMCFLQHWMKGHPVIFRDVLKQSSGLSWEPMVIFRACKEYLKQETIPGSKACKHVINCLDGCVAEVSALDFFKGYTKRKEDKEIPVMLKLKDFPSDANYVNVLPRHHDEFIRMLPLREYTDPRKGFFNIAVKLPPDGVIPDLGPKSYIAYGIAKELEKGNSVTNLHCDMADAVNILVHTTDVYKGDAEGRGGAPWDIFRREDVEKLDAYLLKHYKEFQYMCGCPVDKVYHSIHDQSFYLTLEHKTKLKAEYETSKINLSKVNIQDQQKEGSVTERKKHKKPAGRKEPVKSTIVARASVNDTSNTWSDDDPLILHVPETSKRKKRKKP